MVTRPHVFHTHILLALIWTACTVTSAAPPATIEPQDEADVEATLGAEDITYKLVHGNVYRVNHESGKWDFVVQGYDPDFYKNNYVERDGKIFRKGDDGKLYAVKRVFSDGFEQASSLRDLIGISRGWTSVTLQSPKAPTVRDYVRLRKRILRGESDFLDNRVEPVTERAHSGTAALKTFAIAKSESMVTAKASLDTELLHFVKGDDVWFSSWYLIPEQSAMPTTMMDLETTWFVEHPGIRIFVFGQGYAGFELKWGSKPTFRQQRGHEIAMPVGRWFNLKCHLVLSERSDGIVQLWQDDKLIIDTHGQTLPLSHTIYNSLEIGLSAFSSHGSKPATLYVDDVMISDRPIARPRR